MPELRIAAGAPVRTGGAVPLFIWANTVKIPESRTQADILPMLIVNVRDESDPMRSHACNEALALIASAHICTRN